jgi:ubiquinone/menaquinone biosynthesis C-methylase UbiE
MSNVWFDTENAQEYEKYAQNYSLYRKTGQQLLALAAPTPDMTVVDLACGTGVVTEQLVQMFPNIHKIIAVDSSVAMLEIARRKPSLLAVQFYQSRAEELHTPLPQASVDTVLCNSAFWQMAARKTLTAISFVLKPFGQFIFNGPTQTRTNQEERPAFAYSLGLQMLHIAQQEHNYVPPQKKQRSIETIEHLPPEQIQQIIESIGFEIAHHQVIEIERTAADIYAFLKIPVMTLRYLPDLDYPIRMEILDKAYQHFNPSHADLARWDYYVVTKKQTLAS